MTIEEREAQKAGELSSEAVALVTPYLEDGESISNVEILKAHGFKVRGVRLATQHGRVFTFDGEELALSGGLADGEERKVLQGGAK